MSALVTTRLQDNSLSDKLVHNDSPKWSLRQELSKLVATDGKDGSVFAVGSFNAERHPEKLLGNVRTMLDEGKAFFFDFVAKVGDEVLQNGRF